MNSLNDKSSKAGSHTSLFIQSILDSVLGNVVVIDNEGKIVWVNKQWEEFGLKNSLDIQTKWRGTDYFEMIKRACGISAEGIKEIHTGIKNVLSGKQDLIELMDVRLCKRQIIYSQLIQIVTGPHCRQPERRIAARQDGNVYMGR